MNEQFSYLDLYINEHEEYIYLCITFELYSDDDITFVSCYRDVDPSTNFTEEKNRYRIKGEFENTKIVNEIIAEIQKMESDREYNDSTITDRVGYFGMLVSALHQFIY